MSERYKVLGFFAVTVAVGLVLAVLGPRFFSFAGGPEGELITELKRVERIGLTSPVGTLGLLEGLELQYQRLSVSVDPKGDRAVVTCTLDFTGTFRRATKVSSLGLERIAFVRRGGAWEPERGYAPRLTAVVLALEQRRVALQGGEFDVPADGGAAELATLKAMTRRGYTADAWYIRSEREDVTVSEDYRLEGALPDRPVDERGTRRLTLTEGPRGDFLFQNGLM